MSLHRRLLYAHRQLRLQQGNPSTLPPLDFVERLHDIACFVSVRRSYTKLLPEHWREVGEPGQYSRRSIFTAEGRGDDEASKCSLQSA
jgi:hypothetical protein